MPTKLNWKTTKPKRWTECILITATWMNYGEPHYWDYSLFTIQKVDGYNDKDEPAWYWGIFKDGDEWGDIADLTADKYLILLPLKNINHGK
jgi:hypothetical protein